MLTNPLIVAREELVDHLRDTRSLASSALYTLMGPAVVLLVSLATPAASGATSAPSPLPNMAAVFALVTAFSSGMSVAMDTIAGERERQTLVPLLVNAVSRLDIVIGKWLAVVVFAAAGLFMNLAAFALVLAASPGLLDAGSFKAMCSLHASLEPSRRFRGRVGLVDFVAGGDPWVDWGAGVLQCRPLVHAQKARGAGLLARRAATAR